MEKIIFLPVMVICVMRTMSYGVYTMHTKNSVGAISLFVLAAAAMVSSAYFLVR